MSKGWRGPAGRGERSPVLRGRVSPFHLLLLRLLDVQAMLKTVLGSAILADNVSKNAASSAVAGGAGSYSTLPISI